MRHAAGHFLAHARSICNTLSAAAIGMFLVTLSFLVTTPHVGESAGFLLKDLTLLGAALWTAGEAFDADRARA